MRQVLKVISLMIFIVAPTFHVFAENHWQAVSVDNGVIIHKREAALGLIEVRVQTITHTSFRGFLNLLNDTKNLSLWVSHAKEAHILKRISETENIVQTIFSAPWPASDRDMVTYSQYFTPDKNTLILNVKDARSSYPKQKELVRITDVSANWTLQKLNNGMTHISYTAYANPQGILPIRLANKITIDSVRATFLNLKKRLPLYQ